jgi:hypothetical protein
MWLVAGVLGACGGEPRGVEVPVPGAFPGGKADGTGSPTDPRGAPAEPASPLGTITTTTLTRFSLHTELSLGGRGSEVLCPDPQPLRIGGTYLSRVTKDDHGTAEIATLCGLDVPGFVVSAHGALGGCAETREAHLDVGFDIAEVAQKSFLDVPLANLEAMPVAFVLGAALHDPFSEPLPDWSTPDQWRDDDGDAQPGITLIATALPLLPDGAELYSAVRLLVTPTSPGQATAALEMTLLGSNAGLSGRTLDVIAPELRAGLVVSYLRDEVPDAATCAEAQLMTE